MTVVVIFFVALMATVVWWLLKQTAHAQPWVADSGPQLSPNNDEFRQSSIKVALGVFLAVASSLFALFISAYLIRMEAPDWTTMEEPAILWVNTATLIFASILYQRAHTAAKRRNMRVARNELIMAGTVTLVFLVGQLVAWQQLTDRGYLVSTNPANAFFYLLTGVHGLHLLGGLWVWGKTLIKLPESAVAASCQRISLCAMYWHFLLLVWFVLFALLLKT